MIVPLLMSMSLAGAPADGLWGDVGMGIYPTNGEKVAPNGLVYQPMFRLVADINIGSSDSYLFANSAYYTEKPDPGVTTNKTQGSFDFTKRQYDFNIGYAWGLSDNTEVRFWLYSMSNINRGTDLHKPYGFKDGFVGSMRYYLQDSAITQGYLEAGYYFTKELVDTNGNGYAPSVFANGNISHLLGMGVHGYGSAQLMTERNSGLKELDTQMGVYYRFGQHARNSAMLYLENDFGEKGLPERQRVLLEFRRVFQGG